jgi:hypothetical protein
LVGILRGSFAVAEEAVGRVFTLQPETCGPFTLRSPGLPQEACAAAPR